MSNYTEPSAEQPITRTVVFDARLRLPKNTSHVEVRRIQILAGMATGLHEHNGPVVGSIVEGSAIYQIEGEPQTVLRAGDVFYEPEGVRIARFDALEAGVTFLAYFLLGEGQDAELTILEQ
jgi:quercetin dioxygenase-like cupin family protein